MKTPTAPNSLARFNLPDDEHGNRDSSDVESIGEILRKRMPDILPPTDDVDDGQPGPDRG